MLTPQQLVKGLDSLEYNLRAIGGSNHVAAIRIKQELIDKIPLKTYGNPPVVLSRPLTIEQVQGWFENNEEQLFECAKELREILKAIAKGVKDGHYSRI